MPLHIELIETGAGGGFTVIVNGQFADMLCRDEALGVIAAALFTGCKRLPYLQTYEQWDAQDRRWRENERAPITALLTWNGRQH